MLKKSPKLSKKATHTLDKRFQNISQIYKTLLKLRKMTNRKHARDMKKHYIEK